MEVLNQIETAKTAGKNELNEENECFFAISFANHFSTDKLGLKCLKALFSIYRKIWLTIVKVADM